MIYKNPNLCESVYLIGSDADNFLSENSIVLYESNISINGLIVDGIAGEKMLENNGIFLYESGIVLEGKQAEEYKARKAKEADDNRKAAIKDASRMFRRTAYSNSAEQRFQHANAKGYIDLDNTTIKDKEKWRKLRDDHKAGKYGPNSASYNDKANREYERREKDGQEMYDDDHPRMQDAANRHERRHSK